MCDFSLCKIFAEHNRNTLWELGVLHISTSYFSVGSIKAPCIYKCTAAQAPVWRGWWLEAPPWWGWPWSVPVDRVFLWPEVKTFLRGQRFSPRCCLHHFCQLQSHLQDEEWLKLCALCALSQPPVEAAGHKLPGCGYSWDKSTTYSTISCALWK